MIVMTGAEFVWQRFVERSKFAGALLERRTGTRFAVRFPIPSQAHRRALSIAVSLHTPP
ncbi:hypothetical protein F4554_005107 [Actinopolymorpha rutila]|uniref:Uncharacterized protein n=1 Tax=Actinopolymorpha rutila TaxID=446787 RepID=A0A852ZST8_9ACTN|nr:hypothetical protein [Actinopolymorpha rutila]